MTLLAAPLFSQTLPGGEGETVKAIILTFALILAAVTLSYGMYRLTILIKSCIQKRVDGETSSFSSSESTTGYFLNEEPKGSGGGRPQRGLRWKHEEAQRELTAQSGGHSNSDKHLLEKIECSLDLIRPRPAGLTPPPTYARTLPGPVTLSDPQPAENSPSARFSVADSEDMLSEEVLSALEFIAIDLKLGDFEDSLHSVPELIVSAPSGTILSPEVVDFDEQGFSRDDTPPLTISQAVSNSSTPVAELIPASSIALLNLADSLVGIHPQAMPLYRRLGPRIFVGALPSQTSFPWVPDRMKVVGLAPEISQAPLPSKSSSSSLTTSRHSLKRLSGNKPQWGIHHSLGKFLVRSQQATQAGPSTESETGVSTSHSLDF